MPVQWSLVIGVLTILAAGVVGALPWVPVGIRIVASVAAVTLFLAHLSILLRRERCPDCGGKRIKRLTVVSFGWRYVQCLDCGAFWLRSFLNDHWRRSRDLRGDLNEWRRRSADPWRGGPVVQDADLEGTDATHAVLLKHKRRRRSGHKAEGTPPGSTAPEAPGP